MKGNVSAWEGAGGKVEPQITSQCVMYGSEPHLGLGTRSKALPVILGFMVPRQVLLRWDQVLFEAELQVSLEVSNPQKEGHTQTL